MMAQPITAPRFLLKTFTIIDDPQTDQYIRWNPEGDSFVVSNVEGLQRDVLGKHFNHSNFCSFVRQLNIYGFHKLYGDSTNNYFCFGGQPLFHRDAPHLLSQIERRKSTKTRRKKSTELIPDSKHNRTLAVDDHASSFSENIDLALDFPLPSPPTLSQNPVGDSISIQSSPISPQSSFWPSTQSLESPPSHAALIHQLEECHRRIEMLSSQLQAVQKENEELKRRLDGEKHPSLDHFTFPKLTSSDPPSEENTTAFTAFNPLIHHFPPVKSEAFDAFSHHHVTPFKSDVVDAFSHVTPPDTEDPDWAAFFSNDNNHHHHHHHQSSQRSPTSTPSHEISYNMNSPDFLINRMFDSFTFDDS